ncbi:MAG: DUF1428 family protein [Phycisphaerales bacterium]|nr:MAG: DUF1428 family protein [Phycisphaerales bacterium]
MVIAIYVYRVRRDAVGQFLRIHEQAKRILLELGVLDLRLYAASDLAPKYGCTSFIEALAVEEDEAIYLELDEFRDPAHMTDVMARVDRDGRIATLFRALKSIVQLQRAVRGEFQRVS